MEEIELEEISPEEGHEGEGESGFESKLFIITNLTLLRSKYLLLWFALKLIHRKKTA